MPTVLVILTSAYVVVMAVFLISENRRPQATLAWLLVLWVAPGLGLIIYILFGRDWKAFSKQSKLQRQELQPAAMPLLTPLLARQDAEITRLEALGGSHKKLMMLVRRNSYSALTRRNRVEILQNAAAFYPRMIEDMEAAQHSIHLQYFIWRSDEFTETLKEILIKKARAGVEVRLLYDAVGSNSTRSAYLRELRGAGVGTAPTSPYWRLHTISYRNHRKITVVDGVIGYTGGMNIGQEHVDGGKEFDFWRDTQVRITGEAASTLQAIFMVDWHNAVGENLFDKAYFPVSSTDASALHALPDEGVPVQLLTSGPDSRWAAIRQLYFFMIATAQRHVYLQSPYFIIDASLAEAFRAAALAGVDVKVMLSARPSGDPVPEWAGNTFMAEIVSAGVKIYLYEKGYLHAKTISVDSEICSIGSTNIDIRSFSINYELNAVLYDVELARKLERDFVRDLEDCTEFDAAAYFRRNPLVRFRDSCARLLSPLL